MGRPKGHAPSSPGRPCDYPKPKHINVWVSEEQLKKFRNNGGAVWLRRMLDARKEKKSGKTNRVPEAKEG